MTIGRTRNFDHGVKIPVVTSPKWLGLPWFLVGTVPSKVSGFCCARRSRGRSPLGVHHGTRSGRGKNERTVTTSSPSRQSQVSGFARLLVEDQNLKRPPVPGPRPPGVACLGVRTGPLRRTGRRPRRSTRALTSQPWSDSTPSRRRMRGCRRWMIDLLTRFEPRFFWDLMYSRF